MFHIIFIATTIFCVNLINAQECGLDKCGAIMQQVTHRVKSAEGLYWNEDKLLFVDRYHPQVCVLKESGNTRCTNIPGLVNISSIYPIKKDKNKMLALADRKAILLTLVLSKDGDITFITTETLLTFTKDSKLTIMQSNIDKNGHIFMGISHDINSKVNKATLYRLDDNYVANNISSDFKLIGGIAFSSNYKHIFITDLKTFRVYKYEYNNKKGTLKKREIIFDSKKYPGLYGIPCTIVTPKETDFIWISMCGGGTLVYYNWKKQEIIQTLILPTSHAVSLAYGGKNLDVLFAGTKIISEKQGAEEPGSGAIFAISGTGTEGFEIREASQYKK